MTDDFCHRCGLSAPLVTEIEVRSGWDTNNKNKYKLCTRCYRGFMQWFWNYKSESDKLIEDIVDS